MAASPAGGGSLHNSGSSSDAVLDPRKVSLDDLVGTFLAAKRSLQCIDLVVRARTIVELGRVLLEDNAVLSASNGFVRCTVDGQLDALGAIRCGGKSVDAEGYQELTNVVKALDDAATKLTGTLDALRSTRVESSFRDSDEPPKVLFDFVDEAGVNDLYGSIKQSMDRFEAIRKSLADVFKAFDDDLDALYETLDGDGDEKETEHKYNAPQDMSPVPSLFTSLENYATVVASHLESLVKHYDLCLSALRHTEGGGEYISKASEEDTPQLVGLGLGIANLDDDKPEEDTLSESDRLNMLTVIMKDAHEVDEVVDEIRDTLAEMEDHLDKISSYVSSLRHTSDRLLTAYEMLKTTIERVSDYINGCSKFQIAWEDEKRVLDTKMDEIEGLTEFYEGFASGYDALIVEVHRRRAARRDMDKIARQAVFQIDKLHKAEVKRREDFKGNMGDYLPSDIWPGLTDPPARYEISMAGDEGRSLPQLDKDVIDGAMQRLEGRRHE